MSHVLQISGGDVFLLLTPSSVVLSAGSADAKEYCQLLGVQAAMPPAEELTLSMNLLHTGRI